MDYAALITYVFVMTVTPGPNNIMVTASGANFGFKRTIPHMAGIVFGTSVQVAMACLGLGTVFTTFPILHEILTWVGIAYMFYLAWKMLGASVTKENKIGKPLTFIQALIFQFINPKAWIIIVTVATVFMPKTGEIIWPTMIMILLNVVCCTLSIVTWTIFGNSLRNYLKKPANQQVFNVIMAALLLCTALLIVIE